MDGTHYDLIVIGTGITESILSGLLSMEGKKTFNLDWNNFYGDSGASYNLTKTWEVFRPGQSVPQELGHNRDWNIDVIPKFVMSNGKLVKMMIKTEVSNYLNWKSVDGSYVYQWQKGGFFSNAGGVIKKVPGNKEEALASDLMGLFEKRRFYKFMQFVQSFNKEDPKTYCGMDLKKSSFAELVQTYGLEPNTLDFIGHAIALYTDNSFIDKNSIEVIEKIQLYIDSAGQFGDSPFIYPVYGLSGIPESFARKSAVYGGVYMLNVNIKEVKELEKGFELTGVWEGEEGKCTADKIIIHPSYLEKLGLSRLARKTQVCRRTICIVDHQIPHIGEHKAVQIILPQNQIKRKNDVYIMMIGSSHGVSKKGYNIVIVSSIKESKTFDEDFKTAFDLIGPIKYRFDQEEQLYEGLQDPKGIFVTNTLDETSHFDSAANDVERIYESITGKKLDLTLPEKK